MVGWGGLVFLEYGVVGEVGGYLVCCRGKDVTWCAEWVGVIRLSGPTYEGVAVAWGRGCGEFDVFAAVVSGGSIDLAVCHPSDGIGWAWFWIRLWLGGATSDVGDGHIASDFADGETSEGSVVGVSSSTCNLDILRV